jgi:hypothetical protein
MKIFRWLKMVINESSEFVITPAFNFMKASPVSRMQADNRALAEDCGCAAQPLSVSDCDVNVGHACFNATRCLSILCLPNHIRNVAFVGRRHAESCIETSKLLAVRWHFPLGEFSKWLGSGIEALETRPERDLRKD